MWLESQGAVNLGHLMDDKRVSERDINFFVMKSVVKLEMFVKKLQQTHLPDFKYPYQMEPACNRKNFRSLVVR